VKRREFIALVSTAAAWPLAAHAQHGERLRRIGMLVGSAENAEGKSRRDAFLQALDALGWSVGRNTRIDLRWGAANGEMTQNFAKEIVGLNPDLIFAETTPVVNYAGRLGGLGRHPPPAIGPRKSPKLTLEAERAAEARRIVEH
jgi:hypothetical protein